MTGRRGATPVLSGGEALRAQARAAARTARSAGAAMDEAAVSVAEAVALAAAPSRQRRWRAPATTLLTLSLAVSGCTGPGAPDASPPPSTDLATPSDVVTGRSTAAAPTVVDGLGLAILQNRPDYGKRVLQLSVTNEGSEPVTVVGAQFDSAQFVASAKWPPSPASPSPARPVAIPAGLTRSLPVPLPAAVCPAPDATEPTLTVTVTDASGTSREVTGRPADPFGVLAGIAGEDCLSDAVAAVAALRLGDDLEVSGSGTDSVAHLRLLVDPTGGSGDLHLDEARFTILLAPPDGGTWPLDATVRGGGARQEFTLDAVPGRCDPHAVAEDKRGTFLPVVLEVANGPSGTVSVASSDALRLAIYDFIAAHCGFASAPAG